jgi:NAD(P)-dependent dehydrogenase (short-subunit alcohol dehydrogenase family)
MIFFITGGSRGIGADLVLSAIREGHDVAFTFRHEQTKAEEVVARARDLRPGCRCECYCMDVRDAGAVETVIDRVVEDFETIDVVVNNAGVTRDILVVAMSDEEWDDVIQTNLTGPFLICRKELPVLLANRFGRIINISSVVARGATGQANYAAAKAGLHGLTLTLSKEYGRKGITVNAVVAGFFETDMTKAGLPAQARELYKRLCPAPKGRMGELAELSAVVLFLASEKASFVNGQLVYVTGGLDWTV